MNFQAEAERLSKLLDKIGCVNVFISEGAGTSEKTASMEECGQDVPRDAFGHIKLDSINSGKWFADQLSKYILPEKILVFKSGYFARSAAPCIDDRKLIWEHTQVAVTAALESDRSGCVGSDEENHEPSLSLIDFHRIRWGKLLDIKQEWVVEILQTCNPVCSDTLS